MGRIDLGKGRRGMGRRRLCSKLRIQSWRSMNWTGIFFSKVLNVFFSKVLNVVTFYGKDRGH
jgi:hypothetical protein